MAGYKKEKPDILDVARAAKVSPSTVSRAFNHPDLVKPNTRRRIDNAVRRLGYIRNRAAQTIHGIRSATVGLIVPTIDHAIFAEVVQAFSESVDKQGFTILLATHGFDLDREYRVLRKLLEHRVDGVALVGTEHAPETYEIIDQQKIPAVIIWNYSEEAPLPCIGSSNFEAGRIVAQHLIDLGHREIGLMFPPISGNDRAKQRLDGVKTTLIKTGIILKAKWITESPYSMSAAKQRAADILNGDHRPTAVICGNDVLALGVINGARNLGISVPEQLSVTGIGDFNAYRDLEPALTTIRLPARRIGGLAGTAIVSAITNPDKTVENIECKPELVSRQSAARLIG